MIDLPYSLQYRALSADGNPGFGTVLKIVRALGLRLHASTATH
jgi:DNA-binding phage protein